MSRYLAPFVSPFILLITFWLFFSHQEDILWFVLVGLFIILLTGRILARSSFWRFKLLWFNLLVSYIAQFLFLLVLSSDQLRYGTSFLLALIWLLIFYIIKKYFTNIKDVTSKDYLSFNKFFYYLSFWFLATSLYSLVIFVYFKPLYALLALFLAAFFWALEIIRAREDENFYYAIFLAFLVAQVGLALYFAPLNFYVAGTIATLWFFFIIDNTANQLKNFKLYLGLFLAAIAILLTTSLI